MQELDVAIVGAGPSGASTALHLLRARPRAKIAIFDRAILPREKPCGGAISRLGVDALEAIGATPADLRVDHVPIHAIRVRQGRDVGEHTSADPFGAVVERAAFDGALARLAATRGAILCEGHRLVELLRGIDGSVLRFEGGQEARARVVIGADGTGSAVRRLSGFVENGRRARLVVVETDEVPSDDLARGVLEFDLSCLDEGIEGYIWHFATSFGGRRCVSRGIYDFRGNREGDARALRVALERAMAERGVEASGARRKPYSERVFVERNEVAREGILLVGEAAGLVDPITGEGIAQAIVSGRLAAEELVRVLDGAKLDPARYRRLLHGLRVHRHLRQSERLAPVIYGPRGSTFAALLARSDAAIAAGAEWYAGARLGTARKAKAAASLLGSALRSAVR
ncbi:MAG: NAD(P)/FAD-dependent oxidoreductase [Polyangiales bacterium]